MDTLTLFYDARCGICSRFRKWMEGQPSYVRLEFLPYDSAEALRRCPRLPELKADEEIVVMADDGRLWQGAAAWVIALWALREYRAWSARLATPTGMALARQIVHWISGHRIGLSKLLRFRSDDELASASREATMCADGNCRIG